ncbi:MAG: DNA integrity scanning protein DisA nucleotide-binding domain protein [Desulfovibrionales bacterium]
MSDRPHRSGPGKSAPGSGDRFQLALSIAHLHDGLKDGLSRFSQPSRVALIYALEAEDPVRIFDPQHLLRGHEPKLREIFLDSQVWRKQGVRYSRSGYFIPDKSQEMLLSGLVSCGGWSPSPFYQFWFTEHHPDMCSIGPTRCWLEHASWLLSQDLATKRVMNVGASGYILQECATHAIRDFIVDERTRLLGWDTGLRIYPLLDAVLAISKTPEEGKWPKGDLVFVEPRVLGQVRFLAKFPEMERPVLENSKHVRKLLQSVEHSSRKLVSDGNTVVGIATGSIPEGSVLAHFRGGYGFLSIDFDLVCSFFDGSFHSTTRKAKLVHLEEILLESNIDPVNGHLLFQIVASLVHGAEEMKHGCTLVIDLKNGPRELAGQRLEWPLDLQQSQNLELAKSLAKVDGALHIGRDLHLHGFACLLDGTTVPGENRARGARFNSALRFTSGRDDLVVVVVSSDRPVSIIQGGIELTAQCEWKPVTGTTSMPPTLTEWLEE